MTPVIASTNTDRSAIDFAGVDAGVKMFVELSGGGFRSALAVTEATDKKAKSKVCSAVRNFENFIC